MPKRRKAPKHCFWKGDTLWARQTINGQKRRWTLRTGDVEIAAKRVEEDRRRALTAATYGDTRVTWKEAVTSWAETHLPNRGIGPNTAKRYAVSLKQMEPWLGDIFVDGMEGGIDAGVVSEIVNGRRKAGITTATLRRDLGAGASVCTWAQTERHRTDNPFLDRLRLLKEKRDPKVLPDLAHLALVEARCPGLMAAMVRAARSTGCRQEELVGALRAWLDHTRRELTVIGKGNKLRIIPLDYGDAYEILRGLPSHTRSKFLFWHGNGEPYRSFASRFSFIVREVFKGAYDRVHGTDDKSRPKVEDLIAAQDDKGWQDIGFRAFTFHDIRHLHAVEYLRAGNSIYSLQQRLGHASIKTTEIYLKFLTPEEQVIAKFGRTPFWTPQTARGTA